MGLLGRFNAEFLDKLLLLIWYMIGGAVFAATFGTTFPGATARILSWVGGSGAASSAAGEWTVIVFLCVSLARLCANMGRSLWTVPASYAATALVHRSLIATHHLAPPSGSPWLAITLPAFMMVIAVLGAQWVWARVKPRRMRSVRERIAAAKTHNKGD